MRCEVTHGVRCGVTHGVGCEVTHGVGCERSRVVARILVCSSRPLRLTALTSSAAFAFTASAASASDINSDATFVLLNPWIQGSINDRNSHRTNSKASRT